MFMAKVDIYNRLFLPLPNKRFFKSLRILPTIPDSVRNSIKNNCFVYKKNKFKLKIILNLSLYSIMRTWLFSIPMYVCIYVCRKICIVWFAKATNPDLSLNNNLIWFKWIKNFKYNLSIFLSFIFCFTSLFSLFNFWCFNRGFCNFTFSLG